MSEKNEKRSLCEMVQLAIGSERHTSIRQNKFRLLMLLFLFDLLLVTAVLLSFQETELIYRVRELEQTREVYVTVIVEQAITNTQVMTEVIPYGSLP